MTSVRATRSRLVLCVLASSLAPSLGLASLALSAPATDLGGVAAPARGLMVALGAPHIPQRRSDKIAEPAPKVIVAVDDDVILVIADRIDLPWASIPRGPGARDALHAALAAMKANEAFAERHDLALLVWPETRHLTHQDVVTAIDVAASVGFTGVTYDTPLTLLNITEEAIPLLVQIKRFDLGFGQPVRETSPPAQARGCH